MQPERQPIATAAARGVLWALLATLAAKLSWLAALAVLARLLRPAEFGLFSFGLVFVMFVETVGDLGAGAALIYSRRGAERAAQGTFVLNLAMGALWFALAQLAAPFVAAFFHDPGGEPVIRALAFVFLLKGLGNTHDALLRKRLRFRSRLGPELALALGKGALAVALALAGFGVWSLVWGSVAGRVAQFLLIWYLIPYVPRLRFNPDFLRRYWRMGGSFFGSAGLTYVGANVDTAVVGRAFGAVPLGYYQTAFALPEELRTRISMSVQRVLYPAFARVQADDAAFKEAVSRSIRLFGTIAIPMGVGMCVLAMPIVRMLYGEQWLPMVPLLQIAAMIGMVRALQALISNIFAARGRPDVELKISFGLLPLLVLCVFAGSLFGPLGVASGVLAYNVALLVSTCIALRCIGLNRMRTLAALAPSAVASAVMGGALLALEVTHALPWSTITAELVANVTLGVVLFLAVLWVVSRQTLADVHSMWLHLRAGR